MKKFCVFSGFLGSGKTTTMIALTKYYTARYGRAAMISNDLGNGGLADNRLARLSGANAGEITGNCICYVPEELTARLDGLFDKEGCELVISDIPGFGVGALEHVYHGLSENYPGKYFLAPFTVLVEPRTVNILRNGGDEPAYILHTQLVEADLIVLNKTDLLSDREKEKTKEYLRNSYPSSKVISISARTGEGLEELARALREGEASLRRPDIGYGGEAFRNAMERARECYFQYHAEVCCNTFDADAYLVELAEAIKQKFSEADGAILPHMKLLAWESGGDYAKADIVGADRPVEVSHRFGRPSTEIAVELNATAFCPGTFLEQTVLGAVSEMSDRYKLEILVFHEQLV